MRRLTRGPLTTRRLPRGLVGIALPALALAAVFGYLAGHHGEGGGGGQQTHGEGTHLLSAGDLLLEAPAGWQRAGPAPAIPGLRLEGGLVAAPGSPRDAGLLAGELAPGQSAPLPAAFLSILAAVPRTQVLSFLGGQAYEYAGLSIPGYANGLDLYVVPNTSTPPTVIGCYATPALAARRAECAQIVAKLTLVGQSQYALNPDPGYAESLGKLVHALDAERLSIRRQMRANGTPAGIGELARRLAARLEAAKRSLSTLEAPPAVGDAQTRLGSAITRARDAYRLMARAAAEEALGAYDESLTRVERADDGIDAVLETFALLGYGRT